jgi:hypothetical protein
MKFTSQVYSAVSGSIGGITYAHNTGGMYARARAIPTDPASSFQQVLRNAIGALTTRWLTTVTAAQRAAWDTFAQNVPILDALGQPRLISALAWYIKCNSLRLQAGVAVVDAAPTVFELGTLTLPVPTITAAGTTASVAFTNTDSWANEAGGYLLVYASRAQNATINFFKGPYRFAGKVTGAASPPASPSVVTLPFVSGPTGSRQFFKFISVRADARPSATFRVQATV